MPRLTIRVDADASDGCLELLQSLASSSQINARLATLATAITSLRESTMTKFDEVSALLSSVNDVTNALAANVTKVVQNEAAQLAEIQSLKDQIAAGSPITTVQLDTIVSGLQARQEALKAISDNLQSIATDPANPTPPVPPVVLPPTPGEV